jgi:hypothetical protein
LRAIEDGSQLFRARSRCRCPCCLLVPAFGHAERTIIEAFRAGRVIHVRHMAVLAAERLLRESHQRVLKVLGVLGGGFGIEADGIGLGVIREHLELDLAAGAVYPHHVHLHPAEIRGQLRAGLHLVQGAESLGCHELLDGLPRGGLAAGELERQVRAEGIRLDHIVVGGVRADDDQDQSDHGEYRYDGYHHPAFHLRPRGAIRSAEHPQAE